jgi:SPP1 family predicted phage head-tail adaptor
MASIGNYNIPVTYQVLTAADDGAGGTTAGTWTDSVGFMAAIVPMSGFRRLEYTQIVKGSAYTVTTHYRSGVTKKGRLKLYDGTIMNIRSVVNKDMKFRQLEMICDDGT